MKRKINGKKGYIASQIIGFDDKKKLVLQYATLKHLGQFRKGGQAYIEHPKWVANYLFEHGFKGDYIYTALCHDLLEDTDATEEEISKLSSERTKIAVKLLTKVKPYVMKEYLAAIKKNEIAYYVKIADRICNLRDAVHADKEFQKQYIEETEMYYLEFGKDSTFYPDLYEAYVQLKKNTFLDCK